MKQNKNLKQQQKLTSEVIQQVIHHLDKIRGKTIHLADFFVRTVFFSMDYLMFSGFKGRKHILCLIHLLSQHSSKYMDLNA